MNIEFLQSKKNIFILLGVLLFLVIAGVILGVILQKKEAPPQNTPDSNIIQKGTSPKNNTGSGSFGGTKQKNQSSADQRKDIDTKLPFKKDGFTVTKNPVTGLYELYLPDRIDITKEKAMAWFKATYPNIPLSELVLITIPTSYSATMPYAGSGYLIVPGANGYTVYIDKPYDVSKYEAEQFIQANLPGQNLNEVNYINTIDLTAQNPSGSQEQTSPQTSSYDKILANEENTIATILELFNSEPPDVIPTQGDIITATPTPYSLSGPLDPTYPPSQPNPTSFPPEGNISYSSVIIESVRTCLQNQSIYKTAESYTGVSWKVLAAIHYMEGNCNPGKSLVSGRTIGILEPDVGSNCSSSNSGLGKPYPIAGGCAFRNLLDTAVYGGNHLKGKISGRVPQSIPDLAYALGRYNGLGNRNCGKTPYPYCPPAFDNDDHIYPMSKFDRKHETMYLRYCSDGTPCPVPPVFTRIGALTVIKILEQLGY